MKSQLLVCCGLVLGGLLMSSCSTPDSASVGDPLKAGVRYEVRRALPVESTAAPKYEPSRYFVLSSDDNAMAPLSNLDQNGARTVRTTAYCHSESDHIKWGNLAAAGAPLRFGMVCSAAADWSRYPLGTRFRIKSQPDVMYEVDDYGSALVGSGTIDLYRPTMGSMNAWGVRNVDIEVVQWGSYQNSMRMMRDRVQYPHVRHMMMDIQQRLDPANANANITGPAPAQGPAPVSALPTTVMSGPPLSKADGATASL